MKKISFSPWHLVHRRKLVQPIISQAMETGTSPLVPFDIAYPIETQTTDLSLKSLLENIRSLLFLVILYTIQGIPLGLSASIPFLLQGHAHYKDIGIFSLVSLPFSFKVLWAPIVDSLYIPFIGRRKSWLIPVQLLCSFLMLIGSTSHGVDSWLGSAGKSHLNDEHFPPNIKMLTIYFSVLYFLMATQDIVVDGWALTLLPEKNRPLTSICNAVGQTLGFSIAHFGFLAMQDLKTSNKFFRRTPSNHPLVTLGSFLKIWSGIVFVVTVASLCFSEEQHTNNTIKPDKPETPCSDKIKIIENEHTSEFTIFQTYWFLFRSLRIKPLLLLFLILLTCRIPFGPIDGIAHLKLLEAGIRKEELALFGPFLVPISLFCPIIIGRIVCGSKPLKWFIYGWFIRWIFSFVWLGVISLTSFLYSSRDEDSFISFYYYIFLYFISAMHNSAADIMFASQMGFFARISDPAIGGTYMTLLNTIANVGTKWPATIALLTLDNFNFSAFNPFYAQTLFFSIVGILWLIVFQPFMDILQDQKRSVWLVIK